MKKQVLFVLLLLASFSALLAQSTDKKLEKQLEELVKGFPGDVGIYVKAIKTGRLATYQADSIFPTASMVKIPLLIGTVKKMEEGSLSYHQPLVYKDSLLYEGEDILGSFKDNESIALAKVMMLMLTTSDNTASLWLQKLAGGGTRINQILDSLGFVHTRVNSRTPGREANRTVYGWGQTTPREMATIMERIVQGKLLGGEADIRMTRVLGRNYWDEEALSQLPPTVALISKNGAVNQSRSEVIYVNAPNQPFVFCIITKNQKDERWDADNEGWVLARKVAATLWQYFEPKSNWTPPVLRK